MLFLERKRYMRNIEIRELMQKYNISQWKLGELLGVCENTIQRWLRKELPEEKKQKILGAIDEYIKNGGDKG